MILSEINKNKAIETQFSCINESYTIRMTKVIIFDEGVAIKEIGKNDYIKIF
jgi:hypothetical protein